jgi:hypothetical protein
MVAERTQDRPALAAVSPMCKNGHKRTFKNLYRDSVGRRRCLICLRETRRRWARSHPERRRRAQPKATCINGHAYTPENVYRNPTTGHRRCRTCQRLLGNEWKRWKRAQARKMAGRPPTTALPPVVAHSPSQAPLRPFDAVVAAAAVKVTRLAEDRARAEEERQQARVRATQAAVGPAAGALTVAPDRVIAVVTDLGAVDPADLARKDRRGDVVRARQLAIYALHHWCGLTLADLGRLFGQDHATIAYGRDKIGRLVAGGDAGTLADLATIRADLTEGAAL